MNPVEMSIPPGEPGARRLDVFADAGGESLGAGEGHRRPELAEEADGDLGPVKRAVEIEQERLGGQGRADGGRRRGAAQPPRPRPRGRRTAVELTIRRSRTAGATTWTPSPARRPKRRKRVGSPRLLGPKRKVRPTETSRAPRS